MRAPGYFDHGGDVFSRPVRLDFSSNLNPLGMPEGVHRVLQRAPELASAYPDPACRRLSAALAEALGVGEQQLLVTAGASDLITRVCQALRPRRALVTAPCFSGYERALAAVGAQLQRHPLREEDGFALTESILERIDSGLELLVLCTPNNPTGLSTPHPLLERIACRAQACGTVLLLDESFLPFTEEPSARGLLERFCNLVIAGSFTKIYAIAGLRLGYGLCADTGLLQRIEQAGPEWAVSSLAQEAGLAALADGEFVSRSRAFVSAARQELAAELRALGLRVVDGQANYLLFQSKVELLVPLLEQGMLIRPCARYSGLDASWYRVAVRAPQENRQLAAAIAALLAAREEDPHER